jgi:hypothetical protein
MAGSEDVSIIQKDYFNTKPVPNPGLEKNLKVKTTKKTESEIAKWAKKHLIVKIEYSGNDIRERHDRRTSICNVR